MVATKPLERSNEMDKPVPLEERSAILEAEVMKYARMGYEVRARTQTTAQLVKPKKFSFIWALVWFLLFGIGLIIYLLYYWGKREQRIYLEVDERGRIRSPNTDAGF
jgi:hypothetical protein